ncbi:hypothetical protein [Mycobacterium szulgai]|uniref:hypothetical protein n=1 Tax=Mycobacterium szulgai TaxID=1787 RepID=UPI00146F9F25|nr:hypothetical protein [Mycobacterium szulgai]MCV7079631.1 hypothetical protein [Mycobacterium szulgai]
MTERKPEKAESDVESERHESKSREGREEYVGRTAADDAFDAGQTGAEARSQDG